MVNSVNVDEKKSKNVAFIDEEEAYSKDLYPKGHPLHGKHNISTAKGGKKKKKA